MIEDVQALLNQYSAWLREQTTLREVGAWVEITTPFLDRHNDCLQIYARVDDGDVTLTDDGATIQDLERSGCALDTDKRLQILEATLNGFGVQLKEKRIEASATRETFNLRKHNLVQAMLAVNDMFFLAGPVVATLFREDVSAWLDVIDARYVPDVKLAGMSGFDHVFDFVIPKSHAAPERLCKAINRPNRETAEVLAFAWMDTREVRPADAQAIALLNDTEKPVPPRLSAALRTYGITPIPWAQREGFRDRLAA
jgi:hypothetical protein